MAHDFNDNSVDIVTEDLEVPLDELGVPKLFTLVASTRVNVADYNEFAAGTGCCRQLRLEPGELRCGLVRLERGIVAFVHVLKVEVEDGD